MVSEPKEPVYSLTYKEVVDILKIIDESPCQELHLELNDFKLDILKRTQNSAPASTGAVTPQRPPGNADRAPALTPVESKARDPEAAKPEVKGERSSLPATDVSVGQEVPKVSGIELKSPLSGTFYRAPSPGARPFVEVGSKVERGDQVAIVEVMKLMNSIKAPGKGVVRQILVENETMVKMGQTLMIIEPA